MGVSVSSNVAASDVVSAPRRRGRPPGSKNRARVENTASTMIFSIIKMIMKSLDSREDSDADQACLSLSLLAAHVRGTFMQKVFESLESIRSPENGQLIDLLKLQLVPETPESEETGETQETIVLNENAEAPQSEIAAA